MEEAARPLRTLNENQHRLRKQAETTVDKAAKNLADWRIAEAKSKKHSHACARDNEKLQDSIYDSTRLPRSTSLIHLAHLHSQKTSTDKENAKVKCYFNFKRCFNKAFCFITAGRQEKESGGCRKKGRY